MHDQLRRLSSIEPRRHLAVLLLTLVPSSRRLALARRRTATLADALVVRSAGVGEAGEDVCMPALLLVLRRRLELRKQKGER